MVQGWGSGLGLVLGLGLNRPAGIGGEMGNGL